MIDPTKVPFYNLTTNQLEEFALFCIAVAGKQALRTARALDNFLAQFSWSDASSPFKLIANEFQSPNQLAISLKMVGIGCQSLKSVAMYKLAISNLDLRTCSLSDLEAIYGIGPKTARFFILHTRPDVQIACLDTHILKYLGEKGYKVPKQTPSKKKYLELEQAFLKIAKELDIQPAELDIQIWNEYRQK